MSSIQYWLRLLPVIGLLNCCVSSRLHSKGSIKVPLLIYQDTESNRYDTEVIEYDIVDPKLRMWDEEDHMIDPSRAKGSLGRNGARPGFATISSRTVIPDQNELDQVDEDALKRGNQEINVDKNDEILTEIVDDASSSASSSVTTVQPSVSFNDSSDHQSTIINQSTSGNSFNNSRNVLHEPAEEQQRKVARNSTENSKFLPESSSLQTLPITGNNSSFLQKDANSSFPNISGDTNGSVSVGDNLQNLSQNTNLPNAVSATSLTQVSEQNATRAGSTNDSISQNSSSMMPVASSQSSYTKIDDKNPSLVNMPGANGATKNNTANLTDFQNSVETLQSNENNTSTISADVTEIVDSGDNMFFKGVKNSDNASEMIKSAENSSSDGSAVVSMKSSLKNSTTGNVAFTNTSDIWQTNSSFSDLSLSEKKTVNTLDHKLDSLLNSRKNGTNESQVIERFGFNAGNSSRSLLPAKVRRMNIIHHYSSNLKNNKTSRKLQSFLTAVKEMFKEAENAEDILAWETWGPCSRTCGKSAIRTRQRKCERLVARDFDVACPEPRKQTDKCPVVSCLAKDHHNHSPTSDIQQQSVALNDKKNVDDISVKNQDSPTTKDVDKNEVIGTESDINQDNDDSTSRPNSEDQTEDDENSTEDSEANSEGYDESSEQQYQSNVASIQTANQKRYLYTVWGSWSACTRTCGRRAYTFRKRYCINAVTGEIKRHCQRPTILAKKCDLTPCPVDGGLSDWSKWSSCSGTCGIMERHRSCTKPKPAFGGRECFKLPVQMRLCGTCEESKVAAVQNLASYSPKVLCGFDPCKRVGCLEEKGAICVTDFECNPAFFNDEGNVLKGCRDPKQLFLRPLAQKKCSFNPCSFSKCNEHGAKCLVDTKCRPFFVDEMGNRVNCRGSNVLQISSELICGFNPCKITTCTVDPEAKCVTDYRCNPIFINAAGQRISGCTEDEVEAAEQLSTARPEAAEQSTENPSARDITAFQHHRYLQPHNVQKYREEPSVKKTIENDLHETKDQLKNFQLLEDILAKKLHHDENLDSENETYSRNFENGLSDKYENIGKNIDNSKKQKDITLLDDILARQLNQSKTLYSENTTNSGNLSTSFSNHGQETTKVSGVELLELILQQRLHPHKSLNSKNPTFSEKSIQFQETSKHKSENNFQNLEKGNNNRDTSTKFVEKANKESGNKSTDGQTPDDGIKLSTLHQSADETTEIVDSPSFVDTSLGSRNNHEFSEMREILDKPTAFTNSVESSEKPLLSKTSRDQMMATDPNAKVVLAKQGESKDLADVDRFIVDKLNKKKMMEDAGKTSLGLNDEQGKINLSADGMSGYTNNGSVENKERGSNEVTDNMYSSNFNRPEGASTINNIINNNNNSNNNSNNNNNNSNLSKLDGANNNYNSNENNLNELYSPRSNHSSISNNINRLNGSINSNSNNSNVVNKISKNNLLLNNQESFLDKNPTSLSAPMDRKRNGTLDTMTANNINNKIFNSNNHNNNHNSFKNLTSDHNKNKHNNSMDLKLSETIPTSVLTPNSPPRNATIHYNLGIPKFQFHASDSKTKSRDSKQSTPQMLKNSSDRKLSDKNIQGKIMSLENYLANMKKINEESVEFNDQSKVAHSKYRFDENTLDDNDFSAGNVNLEAKKLKLVGGDKVVPGHDAFMVTPKTEQSRITAGHGLPVVHSSDPNLEISPFDEEVTSSALRKEQSENPEGIPTKPELSRILNVAAVPQLKGSNQESDVKPEKSQDRHADYVIPQKYPSASTSLPLLSLPQQVKQANPVTNKPVDHVTNIPSDLVKKLVLKAVQRELVKLKLEGIVKDAMRSTKQKARKGLDPTTTIFTQSPNPGHLRVAKKPSDNLGAKVHGLTENKVSFSTPKPFHSKAISTNVPIFQDEKDGHSYHEQRSDDEASGQRGGEGKDSSQQGGKGKVGEHQGGELIKNKDHENDVEDLHEIKEFLESPYSEDEKTTAKPDQVTNAPEENNNGIVGTSGGYSVTLAPLKEENTDGHVEGQGIHKMNDEDREELKEPEYRTSYSPSLVDEIRELGLHEYYIKDGFQTPRVPKTVDNGELRHVLKSHRWQVDTDDYDRHKSHRRGYKKKFRLAQAEMFPKARDLSHRRQHNSNGDEIERVPDNYREADGAARSLTDGKIQENSVENNSVLRGLGTNHVGSLTKSLKHLSQYFGRMDDDLLDSGLNTKGDIGNAIVLTAKDDGNSENDREDANSVEDFKNPRNQKRISQKDVLFAGDNESNKNDLMVFTASDDDTNYRRSLKSRSRQPG